MNLFGELSDNVGEALLELQLGVGLLALDNVLHVFVRVSFPLIQSVNLYERCRM